MQIQKHENTIITNTKAQSQDFSIDTDSDVIFDILQNRIYQYKVRTICQEILSNCRDAHRELGKFDNAFEVTVPNRLNPTFKARDYGPGISPDRMADVFVKYGASSKRADNVQTGGLGVGAKSPLAYTDSFSVITYIDGVKRVYCVHTGVSKRPVLDHLLTENTTEANGTEISIAVKPYDEDEFKKAIYRAVFFWDKKPILKGVVDLPVTIKGDMISDLVEVIDGNLLPEYIRNQSYGSDTLAVIDGIPYNVDSSLADKSPHLKNAKKLLSSKLILHFGNGVIQVAASREKIDDSPFSIKALDKLGLEAHTAIKKHITDAFAKVKTTQEYLQTYISMNKDYEVDGFAKFGNYSIEHGDIRSASFDKVSFTTVSTLNRRGQKVQKVTRREHPSTTKSLRINNFNKIFFINKDENKILQNKRIRSFMQTEKEMVLLQAFAGNQAAFDQVCKDLSAKSFHDIMFVEEVKEKGPKAEKIKRENASICLHTFGRERFTHTTLAANTQEWFYVPLVEGQWPRGMDAVVLKELHLYIQNTTGESVCGLADKAVKMVKGNANFKPLKEWLDNFKPSKEGIRFAKKLLTANNHVIEKLEKIKGIDDPLLVDMLKEYKALGNYKKTVLPELISDRVKADPEVKAFGDKDEALSKLFKTQYKLINNLEHYSNWDLEELAIYMNTKYASNKKGGK